MKTLIKKSVPSALPTQKEHLLSSARVLPREARTKETQGSSQTKKGLYLESYGCQMNEYDSGIVRSILTKVGYHSVDKAEEAELILLNTCAIREKAHERIYGRLESFTPLKRKNSKVRVGLLGCMAQNLGDELFGLGLPVDFVLGPDNYRQLPTLLESLESDTASTGWNITHLSRSETYEELEPEVVSGKLAFVTIMRGCDNFCSFCVVPYTRGRERSRSPESIIKEIKALIAKHDIREVTLLGQNVNSYRYAKTSFCDLAAEILAKTSIARIRFTSPHPHDFPVELLDLMAQEERFCSQIHLPLQSGSTSVLERMKRDYTRAQYIDLVKQMRSQVPGLGLSTDIIVGFCGESEAEFVDTLSLVEEVGFDMAYMFRYSEREHTLAKKKFTDDVPEKIKLQRLQHLIELQQNISRKRNQDLIGESFTVLVEGPSRRSRQELMGRTFSGKVVVFAPPPSIIKTETENMHKLIGQSLPLRIESATSATLRGVCETP